MPRLMERISGLFHRSSAKAAAAGAAGSGTTASARGAASGKSATTSVSKSKSDQASRLRDAVKVEPAAISANATSAISDDIDAEVVTKSEAGGGLLAGRKKSRAEIQNESYEQVIGLIERIGKHLDAQNERSDRMVALLERIPDHLESLPEIKRNGEQIVRSVEVHMKAQADRDVRLQSALERLGDSSDKHADVLALINDEMKSANDREQEMTSALGDFRETLTAMSDSNQRAVNIMREMEERSHNREHQLTQTLTKQSKLMTMLVGSTIIASVAGMTIAIVALLTALGG